MQDTGLILGAFIAFGILSTIAQDRFFKTLEGRQPGAAMVDSQIAAQILSRPTRLPSIAFRVTRLRLSALAHSWPYPDVERRRRWALLAIAASVTTFGWMVLRPLG